MGNVSVERVVCARCEASIDELPNAFAGDRQPCPRCGATSRRFDVAISATVEAHSDLGLKHRRPGFKRAIHEEKSGSSFSVRLKRWMQRTRVIDRENDRYAEKVVDPLTGETVHHCDEPLSAHQGHGSAKGARSEKLAWKSSEDPERRCWTRAQQDARRKNAQHRRTRDLTRVNDERNVNPFVSGD
jgi:hypothetical protein